MKFIKRTLLSSALITSATTPLSATDGELKWTPETMMQTKRISDVQLSPDNKSCLFVVTTPLMEQEKGQMVSRIYRKHLEDQNEAQLLSPEDHHSTQPIWSPDGKWIAYLSVRDGIKQLCLIPTDGGAEKVLTDGKKDVQTCTWSPDGKKIAFVRAEDYDKSHGLPCKSLAQVLNKARVINRLWMVEIHSSDLKIEPLTTEEYCIRGSGDFGSVNAEFDFSPDGKTLVFAHAPSNSLEHSHLQSSLALIDLQSGKITDLEKYDRFEGNPKFSPDGKEIAYISSDATKQYTFDRQLALRTLDTSGCRYLAETPNGGSFIAGPNLLGFTKDGKHLLFFEPHRTQYHIVSVPVDGSEVKLIDTKGIFFKEPCLSLDKTRIGCVIQALDTPPEAYVAKLDEFTPQKVSSVNQDLLSYPRIKTETVTWQGAEGLEIEGLLTYPVDHNPNQPAPLLVIIHGGPMGFFDETFAASPYPYPLAAFAQEGFMVLRANPRGSTGYGKEFRGANYNDWGGKDYQDILLGIETLVNEELVDPDRMGVMGWSYGGYMTAWALTQSNHFKAGSVGAGLSNLISFGQTTDLSKFLSDYMGHYSDNHQLQQSRSPIHYASDISCPCLIQHGAEDKRVPPSQAQELYNRLRSENKETELVLLPGMGHGITDPNMVLDLMNQNLYWFQNFILEDKKDASLQ